MTNSAAYALRIGDQDSVIKVAERILPFCYKKGAELSTLLEYRKLDLITGSEVQRRFTQYVLGGSRERHGKRLFRPMPWAFSVGYRLSRRNRALLYLTPRPTLSEAQRREARERHNIFGESVSALSKRYGVSRSAMWRALKK
jgi:hypothetical protein